GIEREDVRAAGERPHRLVDLIAADRTDRAQLLGDDQIGREARDQSLVERVERKPAADLGRDRGIDLRRSESGGEGAAGEDGQVEGRGWEIALVAAADDILPRAEREQ